ncbi:hypothetical protein JIQ42_08325 [Leishmania sp. Namibia]|uniref:hypothetical protein n=1 Tax=Leishmania sp. Namibia TaxID=2802991 RepID=UPI001B747710|nr:hypothetical protein JIQ42_08325 [Leishmania sp. Namibia]
MSTVGSNLERLLPSLYEFLSAHPLEASAPSSATPPRRLSTGLYPEDSGGGCYTNATRPSASSSSSLGFDLSCTASTIIADSYARWRRCITVWRRVIGNDSVFLTVLLHAGCLWCPNYATLYRVKRGISTRSEQQRRSAQAVPATDNRLAVGVGNAAAEGEQGGSALLNWVTFTASAPCNTAVKRRGRRGGRVVGEAAAHSVYALAAAAEVHAEMAAACPASMWALHVLHFLRVEEVCSVPCSRSTRKSGRQRDAAMTNSTPSSCASWSPHGDGGDSSESQFSITSSSSGSSCSGSQYSHSNVESGRVDGDRTSDAEEGCIVSVRRPAACRGGCGGRGRGGRGTGQRDIKRQRGTERGESHRASSTNGLQKKRRLQSKAEDREARPSFNAPRKQWATSSSLLPKLSSKESSGGGGDGKYLGSTLAAVLSVLQQQEQHRTSALRCDGSVDGGAEDNDAEERRDRNRGLGTRGATHDRGTGAPSAASATAEQKHALLLRAIITLVSEEEPLVQQVATALVNEWVDLMSVEAPTPSSWKTAAIASVAGKGEATAFADRGASPDTLGSAEARSSSCADTPEQALRHRRMCDARHYWLSCLLKMVAYLDGVHSALREENAHIGAVLARQGIAPQDAEDIFTKSLPAIFNCALVEETLQSAAAALPASTVRLWMPPPVLLLPFHLIGRGSVFGVWVPASAASASCPPALSAARTSARAQGRFVSCVVNSCGLHLSAEPHVERAAQEPETKVFDAGHCRLGFAVRCAESESLLERRYLASLDHLLPILHVPDVPIPLATDGDLRRDQPDQQPSLRWWPCMLWETAGCPRMDLYVARTLLMLPIPAQSTVGSTTKQAAGTVRADTDATARAVTVDEAHHAGARSKDISGAPVPPSATAGSGKRPRGGFNRGPAMSAEEQAVRHQHPLLYHSMRLHLRAERCACKAGSSGSENGSGELVLLYGHPRGEEATALRHMGFTVRTGSHHRLCRGGGTSGSGGAAFARRTGSSAGSSVTGLGSDGGSSSGRITLARDALGTTLEGMYLIARRVLGLQGLFVSPASASTTSAIAAAEAPARGKGSFSIAGAVVLSDGGSCAPAKGSACPSAAAIRISAQTEREALGTVAATLALTCLVLSHNLLDDLLEQPLLVLWTTELASFTLDVSLLMPRPISRLLKADGLAMALLLQPAQSLLLMVGLAATLVTREVHMAAASSRGGEAVGGSRGGRGRGIDATPSASKSIAPQWHPWWSAFRAAVLRDPELPSCLYSGVWPILESAEDTLATYVAEARWDASGNRHPSDSRRRHPSLAVDSDAKEEGAQAGAPAHAPSRGGRRSGAGGGRRILSLSGPSLSATVGLHPLGAVQGTSSSKRNDVTPCGRSDGGGAPYEHRLILRVSPAGGVAGRLSANATLNRSSDAVAYRPGIVFSEDQPSVPRRLCGQAVLCQDDGSCRVGTEANDICAAARAVLFAQGVFVVPGNEMALLAPSSAHPSVLSPVSRMLSLSLTRATPLPRLTTAVASALWASLEADEMQWPTEAA